ncbi:MAG TPA: DUF1287 domain-containing protein [Chthonomonadaceae bacterium]|nr:DUF1287 domain-containing protein [Chthonomonadaceae bacterium]
MQRRDAINGILLVLALGGGTLAGCRQDASVAAIPVSDTAATPAKADAPAPAITPDPLALIASPQTAADRIVNGAKQEVLRGVTYDAGDYPQGKVPECRGACTDVIVRSLKAAGYDLQARMHADMERHFALYPHDWGLSGPSIGIDHRRTSNQKVFFRRFGKSLPIATTGAARETWQPGDLVYWELRPGIHHCGVLSNVRNAQGLPLVIHNLGQAAQEDCLTSWKIEAHFRYPAS